MELEEGVERVQITITVLQTFKQLFHAHRQKIPQYFRDTAAIRLWDFPARLVFQRSDLIMERLRMIEVHYNFFSFPFPFFSLWLIYFGTLALFFLFYRNFLQLH